MNDDAIKSYVFEAMRKHGGGFIQSLADAWMRADARNFALLKCTFPEYWNQYLALARQLNPEVFAAATEKNER